MATHRRRARRRRPSSREEQPGDGQRVGRRVEDVREHRHEHAPRAASRARRRARRPAPRISAASLQTKAAISRSEAPSAAIVANSWRRSPSASVTNRAIAAAARITTKTSSMRLMPVRSTVVIELTVAATCVADVLDGRAVGGGGLRDPRGDRRRVAARLREDHVRARVVGDRLQVGEVGHHERVLGRRGELLHDADDVERRHAEPAGGVVEHAQAQQVAELELVVGDRLLRDEDAVGRRPAGGRCVCAAVPPRK